MVIVGMHEAKTQFSKLVRRAQAGEEIIVQRSGEPVARIVAYEPPKVVRKPGMYAGQITIHPNFDDPLPELEEIFGK